MDSYYTSINSTTRVKTCTFDDRRKQIVSKLEIRSSCSIRTSLTLFIVEYKFDNGGSAKAKIELLEYDNWTERIQDVMANRSDYAA